jgi:predicted ATPase/DNA-binding SARP family transcriptional activator
LRIKLLGEFSLVYDDLEVTRLNADRPQTLLAYLLLHRQAPQPRQHVAFVLWPDSAESQARTNLRNLLFTLRQALPASERFLAGDTHTLQWQADASHTLDVAQFEAALSAAGRAGNNEERRRCLEEAVSFYQGELLPGNYDDWIIPLREDLNQRFLSALRQLIALLEQLGAYRDAIAYCQRLLQQDPLDEMTYALLMRLHGQIGDRAGVRRVYQNCATMLLEELNVEPAAETRAIYEQHVGRTGDAAASGGLPVKREAASSQRPVRATPRRASRLPPQATPFVGRETELSQLAQLLADPLCRLVTVVGPGGVGKTRLALQVANGHVTIFTHGVAFVAMAPVTDPRLIASAIADELQVSQLGGQSRRHQLIDYLSDRDMLLVLDNIEQLHEGSGFLSDLLEISPRLKLLVSSRRRLSLPEEWVFDLHGLPLPDPGLPAGIATNSGVMLFVQAARRANSRLILEDADYQDIARICHLLAGMPLGLEMAAAWVRIFSCSEIAAEIEKNLDFLISTQRHMPERHRSMRAIFDQSWDLLRPESRAIFCQLSMFRGGFDRGMAEQVTGATLPVLSELLETFLVRRLEHGRFDIHELMRQYAAERLHADQRLWLDTKRRYVAAYLALAEAAAPQLTGAEQLAWLNRLEAEQDNLRQVLAYCLDQGETETAVRLGATLGRFWWMRGHPHEGLRWFRRILDQPPASSLALGQAYAMAGLLARTVQAYQEASNWLELGVGLLRQNADLLALGQVLNELGMLAVDQAEFARAQGLFAECLQLAKASGHQRGVAVSLLNLGMVAHHQQDYPRAQAYYEESLALSRQLELPANVAMVLNSYSLLLIEAEQASLAVEQLKESLLLNQELGYKEGLSWAFVGMAAAAYSMDRLETAAQLLGAGDRLRQKIRAPLPPSNQARLDELIATLSRRLGAPRFDQARKEGQEWSLAQALDLAMQM